jgi:hypothetical protein
MPPHSNRVYAVNLLGIWEATPNEFRAASVPFMASPIFCTSSEPAIRIRLAARSSGSQETLELGINNLLYSFKHF